MGVNDVGRVLCVRTHAHESKRSGEEDDRLYSARRADDQILAQGERVS
jgi:hypothetical protein